MTTSDPHDEAERDAERRAERDDVPAPSTTIGTGSSIAAGCVILVVIFILIAVALRAFTPFW